MNLRPIQLRVDSETHEQHIENLCKASEGLRQNSLELQAFIDELQHRQSQSPIGQRHARIRVQRQTPTPKLRLDL